MKEGQTEAVNNLANSPGNMKIHIVGKHSAIADKISLYGGRYSSGTLLDDYESLHLKTKNSQAISDTTNNLPKIGPESIS